MTLKFRRKPIAIEAFQMTRDNRIDNGRWPWWMNEAWQKERGVPGSLYPTEPGTGKGTVSIATLEKEYLVGWDDWIIRDATGRLYPCKPDFFEATYENCN
jgi:hypothetical protein